MKKFIKFCTLVHELHFPQNFCHTLRQTDIHFSIIVESNPGHPKTFKSIKIRKSIIVTKPILSSIYVEESKNESMRR